MKKENLLGTIVFIIFSICFAYRMVDSELCQVYEQYGMSYARVKAAEHIKSTGELVPIVKSAIESGNEIYTVADGVSFDDFKATVKCVSEDYGYSGYLDVYSFAKNGNVFYAKPVYVDGRDEYLRKMAVVKVRVNSIVKVLVQPGMSDFEKELAIHDFVVKNTRYDVKNYNSSKIPEDDNTAYGVLTNGVGMCAGYSELMHRMFEAANLESKVVYGYSENKGHAWNVVKIEEEYYHIDATFDDPVSDDGAQVVSYQYFNLDDAEISKNHTFESGKYPSCNSKMFNYYEYKHLTAKNGADFRSIIEKGIAERKGVVTVRTADYDKKTFDADVVYEILNKNTKLDYVDVSHGFSYGYDKSSNIINIYLKYR